MSAFGGKADVDHNPTEGLLIARGGSSPEIRRRIPRLRIGAKRRIALTSRPR